ncbi:hypothetical protein EJ02DRAFT_460559 [Clathrospora elynae]|uniref:Secreted protein n=1 Tax=Clathrospora elynae TaxID=706981 RepID=A0A6A5S3L3_9PLEO|nr:hypothetical protein EJ02DRAFT_460559 [Clathrospora elynae]
MAHNEQHSILHLVSILLLILEFARQQQVQKLEGRVPCFRFESLCRIRGRVLRLVECFDSLEVNKYAVDRFSVQ